MAAAVILAGTFASLASTGVGSLVSLGLSVAIAILLTAFPLACLLVPALLTVLGRRARWPGDPGTRAAEPQPPRPEVPAKAGVWVDRRSVAT